ITYQDIESFKKFKSPSLSGKSLDRHISSLRSFFAFLTTKAIIRKNPFQGAQKEIQTISDPFQLNSFKNSLYSAKASHLTIKNYIIDLKQFISWAKQIANVDEDTGGKANFLFLNNRYLEEYKTRLLREKIF